jgi:hypothetical protein
VRDSQTYRQHGYIIRLLSFIAYFSYLEKKRNKSSSLALILNQQLGRRDRLTFEQCSLDVLTLKMEAKCSFKTSVSFRTMRRCNPEDLILYTHRRENLKSNSVHLCRDIEKSTPCPCGNFSDTFVWQLSSNYRRQIRCPVSCALLQFRRFVFPNAHLLSF